MEQRSVTT